ncbi:hypothetical protein, partial [Enterocloster clostridioformis]
SPHPASFRFAVTCNTLAFGYILPATRWIQDFHPLETCAARRTTANSQADPHACLAVVPIPRGSSPFFAPS